jgi:hypothetical protein
MNILARRCKTAMVAHWQVRAGLSSWPFPVSQRSTSHLPRARRSAGRVHGGGGGGSDEGQNMGVGTDDEPEGKTVATTLGCIGLLKINLHRRQEVMVYIAPVYIFAQKWQ